MRDRNSDVRGREMGLSVYSWGSNHCTFNGLQMLQYAQVYVQEGKVANNSTAGSSKSKTAMRHRIPLQSRRSCEKKGVEKKDVKSSPSSHFSDSTGIRTQIFQYLPVHRFASGVRLLCLMGLAY